MHGNGYTLTCATERYRQEYRSKLARGGEQWRILEREILPEIGHVLLADLKPSQVMAAVVPMRKRAPRVVAMGISALRGVVEHASANEGAPGRYSYRRGSVALRLATLAGYIRTDIVT